MKLIKCYTKKLLKDLDDLSQWEDGLYTIRNKKYNFEIFQPEDFPWLEIWKYNIKLNILERFLICRKSSRIKQSFRNTVQKDITHSYFLCSNEKH